MTFFCYVSIFFVYFFVEFILGGFFVQVYIFGLQIFEECGVSFLGRGWVMGVVEFRLQGGGELIFFLWDIWFILVIRERENLRVLDGVKFSIVIIYIFYSDFEFDFFYFYCCYIIK